MDDKSKLELIERLEKERLVSDNKYAPMIVKVIVFSGVGIGLVTILTALLTKVIVK